MPFSKEQVGETLTDGLKDTDVIDESDWQDYLLVVRRAMEVHIDREKIRLGLWKQYPAHQQMLHVKIKAERVLNTLENTAQNPEIIIAEIPDIINYSIFAHRIIQGKV